MVGLLIIFSSFFTALAPSSHAQKEAEKKFMKEPREEMVTFMNKCSGCHSLQRLIAKKRSKEEWNKTFKMMAGKPHADISDEDFKRIDKWISFMNSTLTVGL